MSDAESPSLPEGVQRVARALHEKGHPHSPVMLDDAARTAQQAADALGIQVGQIAKSIIFRRKADDAAVLVVTSGDTPPVTLIDRELFRFEEIWAAAGHPHGVFKLRPQDLERLTGAPVADVVQEAAGRGWPRRRTS